MQIPDNPVVIQVQFELPSNQASRDGVQHTTHINRAVTTDAGSEDFVIGDPNFRQGLQIGFFGRNLLDVLGVEFIDGLVDHCLVLGNAAKLTTAAQQQGLLNPVVFFSKG
jgi:protein-disulfide isomerase